MYGLGNKIVVLILCLMMLTYTHATRAAEILYKEPLQQMRMAAAISDFAQEARPESLRRLRFEAFGKSFDINLAVNRTLLSAAQRALLDERYEIYRGDIAGVPNSWVRLVVADGVPRGMLWDGKELMGIDVIRDSTGGDEGPFIYRLSDLVLPPGTLACSDLGSPKDAAELASAVISEVQANAERATGTISELDVAVIGDFEFTSENGADAIAALTTRMNNVDGIFSMQLGVHLNVNRIDTYTSNNDPFSNERSASELLDELTDYRFSTPAQYSNGLTHLFTGRNLDTNTVGIAYTGALCSRRYGAGLTQVSNDAILDSLIAAHEFGHNFGAPHDGTSRSACEGVPETFLMAPQLNGSSEFSSCSITEMQEEVSSASCISAMPRTDVAIDVIGPSTVLLGNSETITFEASNVGTNDASGVTVDITIPPGVALNSVSTTAGNCTNGAGTVSCVLGTIATGSGATVQIDIAPSDIGDVDFASSVNAEGDADSGNNQALLLIAVNPAVDLVSTTSATPQIELNASTTLFASVENRSPIAATGVTLTITPQIGLSLNSATWTAGTCTVVSGVAACEANILAAQSDNELQFSITGTSAGNRSYLITASAVEAELRPSNNDVNGQVMVSSAETGVPDDEAESGVGSLGWASLLFLSLTSIFIATARNRERRLHIEGVSQ